MLRASLVTCLAASLLFTTPAFAAGVDPGQATAVQREQAQARFTRGKSLYEAGKYDAAATEFQASNDIVASPNARLYYARALREGGHLVQAYEELGRTEVDAREHTKDDARYEKAADTAAAERNALKPKLGFVLVDVQHPTDDTKLTVGGEEIRRAGWTEPAPVMPGTTDVVVEANGKVVRRQVSVRQGKTESTSIDATASDAVASEGTPSGGVTVTTPDAPTDRTKLRPYAYVAGGVGAAGFLTFVVAGLMANSTYGDLQDKCGNKACPASLQDEVSGGKTKQTVANVGLVVGVLGVGVGATLFVLSMPKKDGTTAATLAPVVGPSFSGIKGTF
ncbi:MAG TPA: tetratricopeptide repeat protein [Polyangiaceae bacterium]